ncbi:hypothetical protein TIFTF001_039137 [Ficus carica]|uniref:Secreted protein n=1 Tax=Ficus carica TaxID=3494 RepID=A0AA88E997_FICCA|nr:hypothetical protein TIFTF001_039137 [Ficus carica]
MRICLSLLLWSFFLISSHPKFDKCSLLLSGYTAHTNLLGRLQSTKPCKQRFESWSAFRSRAIGILFPTILLIPTFSDRSERLKSKRNSFRGSEKISSKLKVVKKLGSHANPTDVCVSGVNHKHNDLSCHLFDFDKLIRNIPIFSNPCRWILAGTLTQSLDLKFSGWIKLVRRYLETRENVHRLLL